MTLNISSKVLKIVGLCVLVAGVIVGSYFGWRYYSSKATEMRNLRTEIESKGQEISTLTNEKTTLTTNLETCNKDLTSLKEKYGIALTDKEKAQATASKSASQASAAKNAQKTAEQNLSSCAYYLDAAAQLADVLDTQKQYYKAASVNMANSGSALLDGNYDAALYYANLANDNSDAAASYESRVDTLMGYFN